MAVNVLMLLICVYFGIK